ncbi:Uncharacterised protein (plasmid) [Tsukamurella tyrosinosolvens]|uniref:F5/8 type C domain-containing protein n=2 Tax=Tsukamurella tyrosinosolvens TaxID=57704 RepID=A0A1H4VSN8_TSUTY|nr:hypothetical protein [Tsukamurella tyrosinosolvens]KXO90607.1 hypothetical protein AXK58_22825 [Tsukamurella tyrosinosolvens]SEC83995.1 hypothetical protein SAMN04489793_3324 [Tsukamurella tyrosinosolvens]VEH90322.1 Uncharacterised protein [Tsukamurella tyrosinosolvens]
MSVASALLAAQRRPDEEAARITAAVATALSTPTSEADFDLLGYDNALNVVDSTIAEIEEEKAPRAPRSADHLGLFRDTDTAPGLDLEAAASPETHRVDSRFLLDDPEPATDEVTPMPEEQSVTGPAAPISQAPIIPLVPSVDTIPWRGDAALHSLGAASASGPDADTFTPAGVDPAGDEELDRPSGTDDSEESNAPSSAGVLGIAPGFPPAADETPREVDPGSDTPPTEDPRAEEASPPLEEEPETEGSRDDTVGESDEHALATEQGDDGAPLDDPAPEQEAPARAPLTYSQILGGPATPPSPWGDAEEIDPEPTSPAAADDLPAESLEVFPEERIDDDQPAEPSEEATAPPQEISQPAADPGPSLRDRMKDRVKDRARSIKEHSAGEDGSKPDIKKLLIMIGAVLGTILLVVVIVLSFVGGGRGKPPQPTGGPVPEVLETPGGTPQGPGTEDKPLVPLTASASCPNESDPVAPFAGDKTRAWVCKRINNYDGHVLNITFRSDVVISAINVVPGFNYVAPDGRDEWARHRVVTGVTWRMGGKFYEQPITPVRTGVTKQFPGVVVRELSMTVTGSARPTMGKDNGSGLTAGDGGKIDTKTLDETTAVWKVEIIGHYVDPAAAPGK